MTYNDFALCLCMAGWVVGGLFFLIALVAYLRRIE